MKKIVIIFSLLFSLLLSLPAQVKWGEEQKHTGEVVLTYGEITILKLYYGLGVLDGNGKVREIYEKWPEGWRFLYAKDFDEDYFVLIVNVTNLPESKGAFRAYKVRKDDYTVDRDFILIEEYKKHFNATRKLTMFHSEDSTKIYFMLYTNNSNTGKLETFVHLIFDEKYNLLWQREGYPSPRQGGVSMQIQTVANDGSIYFSATDRYTDNNKKANCDYYIMAYPDEDRDPYAVALPEHKYEVMSVNMFPFKEGVLLLSGFQKEHFMGSSYFICYMLDVYNNELIGSAKQEFDLKSNKDYYGDDDPNVSYSENVAHGEYFRLENEILHLIPFLGYGDEASYVFMYINELGEITEYQFLNNPNTSLKYVRKGDVLHFLYVDNLQNFESKKIVEAGKIKNQCLTYVRYNMVDRSFDKEMVMKLDELGASSANVISVVEDGFVVQLRKKGKYVYGKVPFN